MIFPHRRAERLIDLKIDEARGEALLNGQDETWLERHLDGCARCRKFDEERSTLLHSINLLKGEMAPQGFAGRVLMAAKARPQHAEPELEVRPSFWKAQWAMGGAVAALCFGVAVTVVSINKTGTPHSGVEISGQSGLTMEQPQLTVRAPGMGAAMIRSKAVQIVERHGGSHEQVEDAIYARVPRAELISIMRELSRKGTFKVSKTDGGTLDSNSETITIRFELD